MSLARRPCHLLGCERSSHHAQLAVKDDRLLPLTYPLHLAITSASASRLHLTIGLLLLLSSVGVNSAHLFTPHLPSPGSYLGGLVSEVLLACRLVGTQHPTRLSPAVVPVNEMWIRKSHYPRCRCSPTLRLCPSTEVTPGTGQVCRSICILPFLASSDNWQVPAVLCTNSAVPSCTKDPNIPRLHGITIAFCASFTQGQRSRCG